MLILRIRFRSGSFGGQVSGFEDSGFQDLLSIRLGRQCEARSDAQTNSKVPSTPLIPNLLPKPLSPCASPKPLHSPKPLESPSKAPPKPLQSPSKAPKSPSKAPLKPQPQSIVEAQRPSNRVLSQLPECAACAVLWRLWARPGLEGRVRKREGDGLGFEGFWALGFLGLGVNHVFRLAGKSFVAQGLRGGTSSSVLQCGMLRVVVHPSCKPPNCLHHRV